MTTEFNAEPLELEWIDGRHWRVTEDLDWSDGALRKVKVSRGFVTDFASIPRVLWNLLPPTGPYGKAAVLHDWLYQKGVWWEGGPPVNRGEADGVLRDAMKDLGVGGKTARTIYWAVRLGGWVSWRRYR